MNRTLKVRVDQLAEQKTRQAYINGGLVDGYWLGVPYSRLRSPTLEIHRLWCIQHVAKILKSSH